MALFKIFKGLKKNLPTDKYIDGWCYVTTDDGKMYIDTKDNDSSGRIVLNAEKADKLTVSAGSTSQPVYFKDGVPTKINYTIKKSVPSNAVFTDTHNVSSNVINKTSSSTTNTTSTLTNGNVYLNHIDGGAVTSSHKISGSGATSVTADANGNIIISSTNSTYSVATSDKAGLMSAADKAKLEGIDVGANNYTLPTASSTVLGGVKIGSNVNISSGIISVPTASDTVAGVTIVYPAAKCTTFTSDSGTVTPAAVKKAVDTFAITKVAGGTFSNDATTQGKQPSLTWKTWGENTPYIGYASDQIDGTFILASLKGTAYATGLAIGGGSGNLLWKGNKVAVVGDIPAVGNGTITIKQAGVSKGTFTTNQNGNTTIELTDSNTTYSNASTTAAGLMSAADKTKLNGIAAGANQYSLPLASSSTRGGVKIGYTQSGKNYPVQLSSEKMYVNVPWTDTNTHYNAYLYATDSSGTAHAATTNGNTYLRLIENSTARSSIKVAGAGLTTVSSDGSGNITISTLNGTNAGDSNTPVYLNGGTFTECTSLDLNTTGSAAKLAGGTTLTSSTIDGFLEKNMVKWAPANASAVGNNDGIIMSFGWSDVYGAQLWLDDGSGEGGMKIRNRGSGGSSWNSWRQVLTEYNYNSYSPKLDGTGATGTWGISISGNAATATTATKLATARNIQVNLASTSAASFNGSAAITPGVTGTLAVGNGGTGRTSLVTPTVTWTGGTSAGPTLKIKDSLNKTSSAVAIPSASSSASGIITTSDQSIAGFKTFASGIQVTGTFQTKGEFEIYGSAPHIDFHFNNSTTDYTSRIIETSAGVLSSTAKFYGAVWNDYAEFRTQKETIEPGYCVASTNNGQVYKTTEKFQACDGIVSDTFGFAIGETDECKTPLAVAGRVLAHCTGNREDYHAGDTVCAGPEGKVMKMTREEIKEYPDRIIGIVSEIPEYKIWGSGNVEVNNRIWIKVK